MCKKEQSALSKNAELLKTKSSTMISWAKKLQQ